MTAPQPISRPALWTFLGLTFGLSAVLWRLIIHEGGSLDKYVFLLMWAPGTSAIVTRLLFQRNLRGQGWLPGSVKWLAAGYLLPLLYATVAYGLVWATGQGGVDLTRFVDPLGLFLVLGTLQSTLSATGEELGWRGFLVPALAQRYSFAKTAFLSGAIWSMWHWPLIVAADYNAGTNTMWAVGCFTVMVIGISFPFAWLRLRSGSVWPAALMHASHNLFVQGFFDRVTVDTGRTLWLTTEFGAALAVTAAITAWAFARRPLAAPAATPSP